MEEQKHDKQIETTKHSKPFVFISHDTRDADIAEAFSKLLKSVSTGMLKSFRSSDNLGTEGIEYGSEWYPKIIKNLEDSSDVICLFTELSINKPWILFEAGMAKGKLNTTILGIAVGVPLSSVNTGPFAQIHNCDDEVTSLTKLIKQLVKKLPNSEPDEKIIKQQIKNFRVTSQKIIKARKEKSQDAVIEKPVVNNESVKLFEEVKLMFEKLSSRIENASQRTSNKSGKRLHPLMEEKLIYDLLDIKQLCKEQLKSTSNNISEVWVFADDPLEFKINVKPSLQPQLTKLKNTVISNLQNGVKYVYFVHKDFEHEKKLKNLLSSNPNLQKHIEIVKCDSKHFLTFFTLHFEQGKTEPTEIFVSLIDKDREDLFVKIPDTQRNKIFKNLVKIKGYSNYSKPPKIFDRSTH